MESRKAVLSDYSALDMVPLGEICMVDQNQGGSQASQLRGHGTQHILLAVNVNCLNQFCQIS